MAGFSPSTYGALVGLIRETLAGAGALQGQPGREVELQATATHIQWRYTGGAWSNLVALADLTGESPEFRMNGNTLQYRFPAQPAWTDLFEFPEAGTYTHTQNAAAEVWAIPHNLNELFVDVQVNDFTGKELWPDVEYTSANIVTLSFVHPVQGMARIRK